MQTDFINQIEPTPILKTKKCQIVSFMLRLFLQFSSYLFTALAWYFYDYFVGIATLLLWIIVIGIIRSKLRNSVIPLSQQEYHYNDKAIADWFTARELCIELQE